MYLSSLFWMFLTMYQVMWPLYTKLGYFESICHVLTQFDQHFPDRFVQNVLTTCFTMYRAWEIKNTWSVHCKYMVKIQYFWKTFKMSQISLMYWPCVFNFPSSVHCKTRHKYILNKLIRKMLVELGQYMANGLKISQFGI